jgi:DNA-binding response OmpR family regulator
MMRILLVEDHDQLRRMTAAHLAERGFVVDEAGSLEQARAALAVTAYDALVLDLGLPDGEGIELLRSRPNHTPTPALVLTARDQLEDRVEGLNAGADDYLVKPFELTELEARLRAVLRRPGRRAPVTLSLGELSFDTAAREAWVRGCSLALRRREGLLLEALLEADQRVIVRDLLEERLYGFDEPVTPNALEASVSRLRRALEEAQSGLVLETRRGIGYRLRVA